MSNEPGTNFSSVFLYAVAPTTGTSIASTMAATVKFSHFFFFSQDYSNASLNASIELIYPHMCSSEGNEAVGFLADA